MTAPRLPVARSIGSAVLLTLICVNTLLLAVFGLVDFLGEKSRLDESLRTEVATLAEQLAVNLDVPLWNLELEHAARVVEGVMRDPRVAAVVVSDQGTGQLTLGRARDKSWGITTIASPPALDDVLVEQRPIVLGDRPIGTVESR